MGIEDKISSLEHELEEAWNHNRLLQKVLDHARGLGHDVDSWFTNVMTEVGDAVEDVIEDITGIDFGDDDYC